MQPKDPAVAIAEAVEAASCPVFDQNGETSGKAIAINCGSNVKFQIIAVLNSIEYKDHLFIRDNNGKFLEIVVEGMYGDGLCTLVCTGSVETEQLPNSITPLSFTGINPSDDAGTAGWWMVDITGIAGTSSGLGIIPLEDVEGNLKEYLGRFFLRMVQIQGGVQARSLDLVQNFMADGDGESKLALYVLAHLGPIL